MSDNMRRKGISLGNGYSCPMIGKTVAKVAWGDPTRDPARDPAQVRPYSAITLTMRDGTVFVLTQCMGEVNIDQAVER